jgi:hypothetical protein
LYIIPLHCHCYSLSEIIEPIECLDAKREVKSIFLEAILYAAISNIFRTGETIDNASTISNKSIEDEVKRSQMVEIL